MDDQDRKNARRASRKAGIRLVEAPPPRVITSDSGFIYVEEYDHGKIRALALLSLVKAPGDDGADSGSLPGEPSCRDRNGYHDDDDDDDFDFDPPEICLVEAPDADGFRSESCRGEPIDHGELSRKAEISLVKDPGPDAPLDDYDLPEESVRDWANNFFFPEGGQGVYRPMAHYIDLALNPTSRTGRMACYRALYHDPLKEVERRLQIAEDGDAESQFLISAIYEYGIVVEADPVMALKWLRQAAENDHEEAQ